MEFIKKHEAKITTTAFTIAMACLFGYMMIVGTPK